MLLGWAIALVLAIELIVGGVCLYLAHNSEMVTLPAVSLRAFHETQRSTQSFSVEGIAPRPLQSEPLASNNQTASSAVQLSSLSSRRRAAIVEAFRHSWAGYHKFAWGRDEVRPLGGGGANDAWGGFAVTMVDALDTAMLMGLNGEVEEAIAYLASNLSFEKNHDVSVFEMTIRVLGGLTNRRPASSTGDTVN